MLSRAEVLREESPIQEPSGGLRMGNPLRALLNHGSPRVGGSEALPSTGPVTEHQREQ